MATTNYNKHKSNNFAQKYLINNFYKEMLKLIKPLKPVRVLDAGCGEGFSIVKLSRNKIGKQITGIDNSKEAILLGKKMYPQLDISQGNIYELNFDSNTFDLVICTEVLEHLENPVKALAELKRVSKKYLVFSVPNEPIFRISNFMRGKHLLRFGNHPEHINNWSSTSFEKLLRKNGYKICAKKTPFPWTLILARK